MVASKKMDLKKFPVMFIIIQFFGKLCDGIIISGDSSSELALALTKIVKDCYAPRVAEICLVDTSPGSIVLSSLLPNVMLPVTLMTDIKHAVSAGPVPPEARHKLEVFAVTANSTREFEAILADLKASRWWNHMAHFWILALPPNDNDCAKAPEILQAAFRMDLLEANFMCIDAENRGLIYSFNPFTSEAPEPWQLVKTDNVYSGHPWSLIKREIREDPDLCENLSFDKTRDLGGYEIRVTVMDTDKDDVLVDRNKSGIDALSGVLGGIAHGIFRKLNATVKLFRHDGEIGFGTVSESGEVTGPMGETTNGTTDIALQRIDLPTVVKLKTTYPHALGGLYVMTQYPKRKSQLSKIAAVIDIKSRICLGLVCIITVMFLKFFLRQCLSSALLNTISLICNMALTYIPNNLPPRIYLACLFFFMVTIQGIYQGKLASLLAQNVYPMNIDSFSDLTISEHTIYGYAAWEIAMNESAIEGRYVYTEAFNCTKYVLNDPLAACLGLHKSLILDAMHNDLYVSKYPMHTNELVLVIRDNWPLERKFNSLLQGIVALNIHDYETEKLLEKEFREYNGKIEEAKNPPRKILGLNDLAFAFIILGIGLGCATICFIAEVAIANCRTK